MSQIEAVLNIRELTFGYNHAGRNVLSNVSLAISQGEIVAILGASGCGKSTLLNLIAGLLTPTAGEIQFTYRGNARRSIGYILQEDALLPWRTVRSNLALATELGGIAKSAFNESLKDYLNTFHLSEKILAQYPSQLSGGMRQRVSIIQSLLFNAELLLLDEPFSALDFYTKLSLEHEFYSLVKTKSKAAILVTHDIDEAIAIADRIILMDKNGVIASDLALEFESSEREPESIRGTTAFADYYRQIWGQLKAVIAE